MSIALVNEELVCTAARCRKQDRCMLHRIGDPKNKTLKPRCEAIIAGDHLTVFCHEQKE
ncbi:hypothetical protein LCGC14_1395160 [marine sediment metagenome]|uniref:Uncharacterized protein n=1 Tax=marine sediment metagenome TaxID=412755 RepID=A0A0F9JYT5_9ZZZZ